MSWKQKGFSLPELLVVLSCIGIIMALGIPNFIAARRSANEASAIASTRTIVSAELTYKYSKGSGNFATLAELTGSYMLDPVLGGGYKSGYIYSLAKVDEIPGVESYFDLSAIPAIYGSFTTGTGTCSFYSNESAAIYYNASPSAPTCTGGINRIISNGHPLE